MIESVFETEGVPPAERFGYWRDLVWNAFAPTDMSTDQVDGFHARQRMVDLGDVQVWEAACSPSEIIRSEKLIRRSDPETCCVLVTRNGRLLAQTAGRGVQCRVGDLHCHDTSHPRTMAFRSPAGREPYSGLSVMVPRAELPLPARQVDQVVGARISGAEGVATLLSGFAAQLMDHTGTFRPTDGPRLRLMAIDLISALFASALDAEATLPPENRTQVLRLRMQKFIVHNLGDPELTPTAVAAAHHVSISYLHKLFQGRGVTVSGYIRRKRLENARRDLADPGQRAHGIQAIAQRWGFKHPAEFSRAFRAAYGLSPTEYRQQAAGEPG